MKTGHKHKRINYNYYARTWSTDLTYFFILLCRWTLNNQNICSLIHNHFTLINGLFVCLLKNLCVFLLCEQDTLSSSTAASRRRARVSSYASFLFFFALHITYFTYTYVQAVNPLQFDILFVYDSSFIFFLSERATYIADKFYKLLNVLVV